MTTPHPDVPAPAAALVPVSCCPHPFENRRVDCVVPAGLTVAEIVSRVQPEPLLRDHGLAFIGDQLIPRAHWHRVRPKPGALLVIRLLPSGGGARLFASIGIAVLALAANFFLPGSGIIVALLGNILLNVFLPPPTPELSRNKGNESPTYAISGARNRADPWGKVPFVLGRFRVTPAYAAQPWREVVGSTTYWRAMFAIGHGPLAIEEMRIGETLLEDFAGVEYDLRRGYTAFNDRGTWSSGGYPSDAAFGDTWTRPDGSTLTFNGFHPPADAAAWDRDQRKGFALFPDDVYEDHLTDTLTKLNVPIVRTTQLGSDEIGVEFVFQSGVYHVNIDGRIESVFHAIRIEQSPAGADQWVKVTEVQTRAAQRSALYKGHRWRTDDYGTPDPQKKYDVRVTWIGGMHDGSRFFGEVTWYALRTITRGALVPVPGVTLVALRIQASGQLQGSLDEFNVVAHSIARDWDAAGGEWVWRPTSQPAALVRHILQHSTRETPAPDDRIDLGRLAYWDGLTRPAGRTFNGVIEAKNSLFDALQKICRVGRAAPMLRDLLFSVVIDEPRTTPVRLFTPRNSWDYQGEITHAPLPHAYRIAYVDHERDWKTDEVVVYDDGYDAETATRVDRVEWPGIHNRDQAWKEGRFHLAQQRLRREVHRITCDFEHLACERGDLVALQYDAIAVGLASARIAAVTDDGAGSVATLTLDAALGMDEGRSYGLRVRRVVDGSQRTDLYPVVTVAGEGATLILSPPVPLAEAPAVGDLAAFGEWTRETLRVLVRDIEPQQDLTARLTLIAEAPGVHLAEAGTIPPHDPVVTLPGGLPAPVVIQVVSDETALLLTAGRTLIERVIFQLQPIAVQGVRTSVIWRFSGVDGGWKEATIQSETASEIVLIGLESGYTYDFRLQRLHPDYYSSRATAVNGHYLVGRSAPPQPLTNLNVAVVGGAAMLRWDLPADLDVQYGGWIEFRHTPQLTGAQFQNTVSIGRGINGDQTHVYLPLLPGSYFAVACDSGGRASTPVSVSTRQASVLAFSPVDELVEDPLFLGARSYCQVTDGVLQLSDADFDLVANVDALPDWDAGGTGIASAGTYDFSAGMDLGAVRRVRLTAHILIEAVNQNDLWDLRSGTIDDWPDIDGTAGAAIDASLWGRLTDDDPAGNPAWGPLMRIDSAEVQTRAIGEIECRMHSRDATFNLRLSELRLKTDEVR